MSGDASREAAKAENYPSIDRPFTVANNMLELVGNTPMVYLTKMNDTKAKIALKLEMSNPVGSVKDRLGLAIIDKAEKDGVITPGESVIVEATSGNTGIALAFAGAIKGYKVIITMPETMSLERRALLRILGAEVILTPGSLAMKGAVSLAKKIVSTTEKAVAADQFATKYNAQIHEETTGPEVWYQTEGKVDYFVGGVGTGGTITGVGRYLQKKKSDVKIVAVEPTESPVISGGKPGPHKIQGIGAGFIPEVLDTSIIAETLGVPSATAITVAQELVKKEGVFCGFSSGANVHAALEIAKRPENEGKLIVCAIPSYGERYLSSALYQSVTEEVAKLPVVPADALQ